MKPQFDEDIKSTVKSQANHYSGRHRHRGCSGDKALKYPTGLDNDVGGRDASESEDLCARYKFYVSDTNNGT